jgi:hypothetical protein
MSIYECVGCVRLGMIMCSTCSPGSASLPAACSSGSSDSSSRHRSRRAEEYSNMKILQSFVFLSGLFPVFRIRRLCTYVFGTPRSGSVIILSGSFHQQAKKLKQPWFLLFSDFSTTLSLKPDVNVPSKQIRKKMYFLLASWKSLTQRAGVGSGFVCQRYRSAETIRIKIHGSGRLFFLFIVNIVDLIGFVWYTRSGFFWPSLKGKSQNVILIAPVIMFTLLFSDR